MIIRIFCSIRGESPNGTLHVLDDGLTDAQIEQYVRSKVIPAVQYHWKASFRASSNIRGTHEVAIDHSSEDMEDAFREAAREVIVQHLLQRLKYSWAVVQPDTMGGNV